MGSPGPNLPRKNVIKDTIKRRKGNHSNLLTVYFHISFSSSYSTISIYLKLGIINGEILKFLIRGLINI